MPFWTQGPSNNEYGRMSWKMLFWTWGPPNNEYGRCLFCLRVLPVMGMGGRPFGLRVLPVTVMGGCLFCLRVLPVTGMEGHPGSCPFLIRVLPITSPVSCPFLISVVTSLGSCLQLHVKNFVTYLPAVVVIPSTGSSPAVKAGWILYI